MTSQAIEESTDGHYVYCIIRTERPPHFAAKGVGERGDGVYTIHDRRLAAVVSDSAEVEYERTRRNMMAHTLVLEEVMQQFTILPVRFGTVGPSAEEIRGNLLKRRSNEFHTLLDKMEGECELGLKALWYEGIIFREIIEEDAGIRQLRDSLLPLSPEQTYYDRIRLGQMIEKAVVKKREEDAERILSVLRPIADRTRTNTLISDRMILNAAFLVERERQREFDEAVEKVHDEVTQRIALKYVGPVPPYNFVNIVVTWEGKD